MQDGALALSRHPFAVTAGERARLDITVEPGVPTRLLPSAAVAGFVAVELRAAAARPMLLGKRARVLPDRRLGFSGFALQQGDHRLRIAAADGRVLGERAFTVVAGAPECRVEVPVGGR